MELVTAVRAPGPLTRADLDAMPDDGCRYELLDGAILMTPAPGPRHQVLVTRVWRALADAAPGDAEVFVAPLDVTLPTGDVLQPDVVVAHRSTVSERDVTGVPLLVVEVLSPSTRRRDLGDKLTAYRDAGCPAYWIVDPDGPSLRVLRLRDGEYVDVPTPATGSVWSVRFPFSVEVDLH